jgi:hypothetical protein
LAQADCRRAPPPPVALSPGHAASCLHLDAALAAQAAA